MNINNSTNFSFGWVFHNLFKQSAIFGHFGCSQFVANISNTAIKFPAESLYTYLVAVSGYIPSWYIAPRR